ncbi:hypothetical protein ACNI5A_31425, partial [Klebsiella pneumoniae]|uniref:hypothetical protein n=1 Tax=Klebsiella pneumoniae TaxID=573 RepID=UPI003A8749CF
VAATLEGYSDEHVWARASILRAPTAQNEQAENPRLAEFAVLSSGQALIGTVSPDALLHAETLPRSAWDPAGLPVLGGISSLVAVH